MRRSQASQLIDDVRVLAAADPDSKLTQLLQSHGIVPLEACDGSAHSNSHIDHCMRCAPRWGWVGPVEKVT